MAAYGEACCATREVVWWIQAEPGIDSSRSDVLVIDVTPDGRHGTLVITPRDRYDKPLGTGRGDSSTVPSRHTVTLLNCWC
ncbi:MAG: hypothetical protein ACKVQU_24275 [Burkholderiales bacterium]